MTVLSIKQFKLNLSGTPTDAAYFVTLISYHSPAKLSPRMGPYFLESSMHTKWRVARVLFMFPIIGRVNGPAPMNFILLSLLN